MKQYLLLLIFSFPLFIGFNLPDDREKIDHLVDKWHKAAATADEDIFFGSMTEECIYLGTDISERWKRDELKTWSAKYFDSESAWDFTPYDRIIHIDEAGKISWWDEKLDTWMGKCRGSGVAKKIDGQWKIAHYHLSVAVPNEIIKEFIQLVERKSED